MAPGCLSLIYLMMEAGSRPYGPTAAQVLLSPGRKQHQVPSRRGRFGAFFRIVLFYPAGCMASLISLNARRRSRNGPSASPTAATGTADSALCGMISGRWGCGVSDREPVPRRPAGVSSTIKNGSDGGNKGRAAV